MSTLKVNNLQDLGAAAVVTNGVVNADAITSLNASALPAGSILQVVSTTKTDTFSTTSTSFTDVTGLSVSITPSSSANKILVLSTIHGSQDVGLNRAFTRLMRDATAIAVGDAASSRLRASSSFSVQDAEMGIIGGASVLDSPSTTSSVTYKWQMATPLGGTIFLNRSDVDSDSGAVARFASTITVMEVAG